MFLKGYWSSRQQNVTNVRVSALCGLGASYPMFKMLLELAHIVNPQSGFSDPQARLGHQRANSAAFRDLSAPLCSSPDGHFACDSAPTAVDDRLMAPRGVRRRRRTRYWPRLCPLSTISARRAPLVAAGTETLGVLTRGLHGPDFQPQFQPTP